MTNPLDTPEDLLVHPWRLRDLADCAQAAAELAKDDQDPNVDQEYADPAIVSEAYAMGVEDVLRWLAGDIAPTELLAWVLRAEGKA